VQNRIYNRAWVLAAAVRKRWQRIAADEYEEPIK
jgi:hypothetical protein